jgi:hypothetical protein
MYYLVGDQYAILRIPRKEADRYGISDSEQIAIESQPNGILIKRKEVASVDSTSDSAKSQEQLGIAIL